MAGDPAKAAAAKKRKWPQAITALLCSRTVEEAAKVLHVGATTLYEWRRDPEFQEMFDQAQRDHGNSTLALLIWNIAEGAKTERRLLKSKKEEIALETLRLLKESAMAAVAALQLQERVKRLEEGQRSPL